MNGEVWLPIDGWPYEVSNFGRVRRIGKAEPIAQRMSAKASGRYAQVDLWRWNRRKTVYVHRLVAAAFHGRPQPFRREVNHLDCDTSNNAVDNLEWCSSIENRAHRRFMEAAERLEPAAVG